MAWWCLAPLPSGEEPRWTLRSEDYHPPAIELLENYLLDSFVEAGRDDDQDFRASDTSRPTATTDAKPACQTRASITKVARSKAELVKTAKLEAEKKKRNRGVGPTPAAEDAKEKDEVVDSLSSEDDRVAQRSPSPAMKQKLEEEMKTIEEDLRRIREAQAAKVGVQTNVPKKIPGRLLKPKVHGKKQQSKTSPPSHHIIAFC